MAKHRIPGLIVTDEDGNPYTVLPGSQVLRFVIPSYVQDDPQLAAVYDEQAADELCGRLAGPSGPRPAAQAAGPRRPPRGGR